MRLNALVVAATYYQLQCTLHTCNVHAYDIKPSLRFCGVPSRIGKKRIRKRYDLVPREKGRDLTQSYDKSPYTSRNVKRGKVTAHTMPQICSITQRLRADLGRSVGVTTATQLVWLTGLRAPTFPLPATAV